MKNLNGNQNLVLKFLNSKTTQVFNMTQIGVQVGNKIPKSASTWSKPILEHLLKLELINKVEEGEKTFFTGKVQSPKIDLVKEENFEKESILIDENLSPVSIIKPEKNGIAKRSKEGILSKINIVEITNFIFKEAKALNDDESKTKKSIFLKSICNKELLNQGIGEKSLKANAIKGFVHKLVRKALGDNVDLRTDGREFEIGEEISFSGGKTLDKSGEGIIKDIRFNHFGHRYMKILIDGGLIIDKTDKFLIKK